MKKYIYYFLLTIVLASCISHEKKMLKKYGEQPEWAGKAPSSFSYYYGVGIINKNITDYRKAATKLALDNLINEISVNVSSSSLFSTLETNDSFNQEFSQNIHLSSKETIEGYELIDSWENENQYFIFYQLSKVKHKQLKDKRIKLAVQRAKKTHLAAQDLKLGGNHKQAMVSEVQALEILNPFLDQDLNTELNGKEVNMAVQVIQSIISIENEIVMTPSFYEKHIKVGKSITARDLYVTVTDIRGKKLSNIPVLFVHKAVSSKKRKTNSDSKGIAAFNLGKVKSDKGHQEILVSFDFNSIIEEATQNRLIRKIINYQAASKVQITLHVELPRVFIRGKETLNGELSEMQLNVKSSIQQSLLENKFQIANLETSADLILNYEIRSNAMSKANPLNVVSSSGNITVIEMNKIIYSHEIPLQKGTHITLNEAVNEAYKKVTSHVQKRIIPQFTSQYFNY